jgi:hypothetical protein
MGFIQIMMFNTSKPNELQALADEWEGATGGKNTVVRRVLCENRDNWGQYFNIVFFDSHEAAVANSALPETEELAAKLEGLVEGRPTFYNLDVIEDRS